MIKMEIARKTEIRDPGDRNVTSEGENHEEDILATCIDDDSGYHVDVGLYRPGAIQTFDEYF